MNILKQFPRLMLHTLVVLFAVVGALLCVSTAFELTVNLPVLVLVTFAFGFLFAVCFQWKRILLYALPVILASLGVCAVLGMFAPLLPSIQQLFHDVMVRFSSAYANFSFTIPTEPEEIVESYTLLFALCAIPLSLWMSWGVGYRSCLISVAGTLPFLLLCVVINDTPPDVVPLVLLLASWLTVLLSKERTNEPPAMDAMRMSLVLMAVLLFLSIVGTVYPKDDTASQELPELIQSVLDQLPGPMRNALSRDGDGFLNEELGADTSEILDLTTQGTRDRSDTIMMRLYSTATGVLYLRGAAKDVYTGSTWESANGATVSDSVYSYTSLGNAFGDSLQAAVQIHNYFDSATVAFTPYGYISCTGVEAITSDLRVSCLENDYITYFWPGLSTLDLSIAEGDRDESYDSYVMATCLELPEDTKTELYQLALSYGYDTSMDTLETIAWTVALVNELCSYQLDVSCQPVNCDFAVYFLTESQSGYCVHFATATATMLRALGIPARYASGYRVEVTEAGVVTDVTDEDTHAWTEVYLSGLGWIPVESTPGFEGAISLPDLQQDPELIEATEAVQEEAGEEPIETEEIQPEESQSSNVETDEFQSEGEEPESGDTDEVESTEYEDVSSEMTEGTENGASADYSPSWRSLLPFISCVFGMIALCVIIIIVRFVLIHRKRKSLFCRGTGNEQLIALWVYAEKLIPWGAVLPEELKALALKAKFSQHQITADELKICRETVFQLSSDLQAGLVGWKAVRFRWIACLGL